MIRPQTHPPAQVTYGITTSPIGKLVIGITENGAICRIGFLRHKNLTATLAAWQKAWKQTHFISGVTQQDWMTQDIVLVGTAFQHKVWRALTKIPAGSTTTYGALARSLGKPLAMRAVGTACGANPVPYLIPCHRVVPAAGGLGGFSGGIEMKKVLLQEEGTHLRRAIC